MQIHNAQTKGTQHKSMVKLVKTQREMAARPVHFNDTCHGVDRDVLGLKDFRLLEVRIPLNFESFTIE